MKNRLIITALAFSLSACATPLEPVRTEPEQFDKEGRADRYADCLRRKDKKPEDPPCLLE